MIQAIGNQAFEPLLETFQSQLSEMRSRAEGHFGRLFESATKAGQAEPPARPAALDCPATLGDPDVQGWLDNYYVQQQAAGTAGVTDTVTASTSYQPATGAALSTIDEGVYGPDAIYTQALANQIGNGFAAMTGEDPGHFTAQLPGVPSVEVQQAFDHQLAYNNAQRLLAGEPIDTAAYWSDPGPLTLGGRTFTSQELGYAGPGQSSGPEPIWISDANQVGPDTFTVPGYSGTVSGIKPGHFYTLEQLEKAGLPPGQPEGRFVPGSWSTAQTS